MYVGEYLKTRADDPLIIMATSGEVVTYRQFEDRANQMAHLYRAGLKRLDHVAFLFENNPRMLECEAGAERSGLYYTCINSYLAPDEAAYIINDSESRVVVTSAAKREVAMQLPDLCPNVERWLMADVDTADAPFESRSAAMAEFPTTPIDDEQLGAMLYSSGTTGQPKGILRPLPDVAPGAALPIMGFVQLMFRFREGQTYLSAFLYHSAPQASVSATIRMGGTAVIMEKFDPAQFLDLVREHRITHSQMVPTMFSRLLKLPDDVRAAADLSSLEVIVRGRAVSGAGEAADDRVVRAEDHRVLRRDRGERIHVLRLRGVAGASRHGGQVHPRRAADPRRGGQPATDRHARHRLVQGRHQLRVPTRPTRQRSRATRPATRAPSATSAISTRTATSTSPTASRT